MFVFRRMIHFLQYSQKRKKKQRLFHKDLNWKHTTYTIGCTFRLCMSIYLYIHLLLWWLCHRAATRFWNLSSHQLGRYVWALESGWTVSSGILDVNVTKLHVRTWISLAAQKLHCVFVSWCSSDLLEAYVGQLDRWWFLRTKQNIYKMSCILGSRDNNIPYRNLKW